MEEHKIKNLEMIQAIISRMANNSFLLKGWSITIIAGLFSLNSGDINPAVYLLIYFILILFWLLDSYYLQLERQYRILYDNCRKGVTDDFDLNILSPEIKDKTTYTQVLLSRTEIGFYLLLALIISMVFWII